MTDQYCRWIVAHPERFLSMHDNSMYNWKIETDKKLSFIRTGEQGALEFWVDLSGTGDSALEVHYASCPDYMQGEKPHHEHCMRIPNCGPCWHD